MPPFPSRAAALAAALFPVLCGAVPLTLEETLQLATQRSETSRAARAGAASAAEASRAAGELPDPVLGVSLENLPVTGPDRFRANREEMTMKRIGISQEWVSPQKRSLRRAAATAMVARAAAAFAGANSDTRLQTALAYIDAYYAAEAVKLGVRNEALAREAMQTARARLAGGSGGATDALAVSAAQGIAEDETADLRQQLASMQINLARWSGRQAEELAPPAFQNLPGEQAFVERYPAVVAKKRDVEVARGEAAVAASNRKPNWTWQLAYGQRTGFSDMATIGVNIPLPIAPGARQDRETASKLALVEKAEAELAEAARAAQAEYLQLASEEEHHLHRIERYRSAVLAAAVQRAAAATAAYGSNQANLATVFEARRAELEARRKLLDLEREFTRMRAQLALRPLLAEELQ